MESARGWRAQDVYLAGCKNGVRGGLLGWGEVGRGGSRGEGGDEGIPGAGAEARIG